MSRGKSSLQILILFFLVVLGIEPRTLCMLGKCFTAGIAEVLDPKGLREGMNRQDTYREAQKADDQLANFLFFLSKLYTKEEET
jgi:hypothetical protein